MSNDLVSCIMATANRRPFVPLALRYWLDQEYGPSELVIVDDGPDPISDLAPQDERIRYLYLGPEQEPTGTKFNLGIEAASGDLLALWADDDWIAPWRLSYQLWNLDQARADVCGLDRMIFFDVRAQKAMRYWRVPGRISRAHLLGGSLLFRRSYWQERPFSPVSEGEDTRFVQGRLGERTVSTQSDGWYVAIVHGENTSSRLMDHDQYTPVSLLDVRRLMDDDFDVYAAMVQECYLSDYGSNDS